MSRAGLALSVLLIIASSSASQDDSGAADLMKRLDEKAARSKSFSFDFALAGLAGADVPGQVRFKAPSKFVYRITMPPGRGREAETIEIKSDGRRVLARGPRSLALANPSPSELADRARTTLTRSALAFTMAWSSPTSGTIGGVKLDGAEKLGGIEVALLAHTMTWERPQATFEVKSWIDRGLCLPLKREIGMRGRTITETYADIKIDPELPDDLFALQSPKSLVDGRALQVERSVTLFATYTGRPPRSLAELAVRPAWLDRDVFWPEGGFWIGPKPPVDVPYAQSGRVAKVGDRPPLPAPDCRAVAAPSERIGRHFTARVRLELLKAAVEAFEMTYGEAPKRGSDLWAKPDWADVWPSGGFVGGEPVDPWGKPFEFALRASTLRIRVSGFRERSVLAPSLSREERKAMESAAVSRFTDDERKELATLVARLSAEDLEARDRAAQSLVEMGPGVVEILETHRQEAKDADIAARIKSVQARFPAASPAWLAELQPLALTAAVRPVGAAQRDANERAAVAAIRKLAALEADLKANGRKGEVRRSFWVRDVAGLHGFGADAAVALADVSEGRGQYADLAESSEPEPVNGYYFAVLKKYETPQGEEVPYDDGSGRNAERFAILAWPEDPRLTGHLAFIVNEADVVFKYNMAPDQPMIAVFPNDPSRMGWSRVE